MIFSSKKKSGCGKFGPMRVDGDGDCIVELQVSSIGPNKNEGCILLLLTCDRIANHVIEIL